MLLVILPGHIDLSVGLPPSASRAASPACSSSSINGPRPPPCSWLLLYIGITLYTLMGFIIAKERIPAFIITLGGLLIFKGVFWKVIGNQTIPVKAGEKDNLLSILTTYYLPAWAGYALVARHHRGARGRAHPAAGPSAEATASRWKAASSCFQNFSSSVRRLFLAVIVLGRFRGVPLSLTVLGAVAFVIWVITNHTRFGRYLYAIGGNEEAAIISGVPVMAVTIGAFIIAGITATITGFMQTAYGGASTTTTGELMELDAIASCVIGGNSPRGRSRHRCRSPRRRIPHRQPHERHDPHGRLPRDEICHPRPRPHPRRLDGRRASPAAAS